MKNKITEKDKDTKLSNQQKKVAEKMGFSYEEYAQLIKKVEKVVQIDLPLEVYYSKKKKFILNLNNYRNAHYRVLSTSKRLYSEQLVERIKDCPRFTEPVKLAFTYYARSNRRLDISNPCSIIDKFTCDALVKAEILEDDSFEQIKEVVYKFGGVDKDNPRCVLELFTISEK